MSPEQAVAEARAEIARNLPTIAASLVALSLYAESERTRADCARFLLDRMLWPSKSKAPVKRPDPIDALIRDVLGEQPRSSTQEGTDG